MVPVLDAPQQDFIDTVWRYYQEHARHDLPWRLPEHDGSFDPYKILVSELMLQQTQVARVTPKYQQFIEAYPTPKHLAQADLGEVLRAWQGLGYNRRAKYLWEAAHSVVGAGKFPSSLEGLIALPGVGVNTAGAIMAYAFNKPALFIETNIRTVYIHHFFPDAENVSDNSIRDRLVDTLDTEHPREFYWALMDYGTFLKASVRNLSQSKHYAKQTSFAGSRRQVRGRVLRLLATATMTRHELAEHIVDDRLGAVLHDLEKEGMVTCSIEGYRLGNGTI